MTPFNKVYTAFLARILEDEWQQGMYDEAEQDWRQLMENALTWFKFPRVSLEHDEDGFVDDLTQAEIQIIADFIMFKFQLLCIVHCLNLTTTTLLMKLTFGLYAKRRMC